MILLAIKVSLAGRNDNQVSFHAAHNRRRNKALGTLPPANLHKHAHLCQFAQIEHCSPVCDAKAASQVAGSNDRVFKQQIDNAIQ